MIFLNFLFGYLCLLMIIKWVSGSTADLYHIMIYMFLQPGDAGLTCDGGCTENRMFAGQGTIQARPPRLLRGAGRAPAPPCATCAREPMRWAAARGGAGLIAGAWALRLSRGMACTAGRQRGGGR
jgi:hypothetical protein